MKSPNNPRFTTDWFSIWIPIWREHVLPHIAPVDDARWLEVGSYEGRSALWTLDNLLLGKRASLICLDAWYSEPEYEPIFDANLAGRPNVTKIKGQFENTVPSLLTDDNLGSFHGAYLDGSHQEVETLASAKAIWRLLRPGGILVFDDYNHEIYPGVKLAVDSFLSRQDVHYDLLFKGPPPAISQQSSWQVIVMKKETAEISTTNFPALLERAKTRVSPRTIIDIGASNGSWSLMAQPSWPDAHYFLVEANPVFLPDLRTVCEENQRFDYVSALAGASDGKATCRFNKENPFQGVLLGDSPEGEPVDTITIDSQVRQKNLTGPYLLKFDVHEHELAILQGAQSTLLDTCAIVMEIYVWRQCVGSLRFWEMCTYLEYLGFRPTDLCDPLYRPFDGRLSQIDVLFERIDAPGMDSSRWA